MPTVMNMLFSCTLLCLSTIATGMLDWGVDLTRRHLHQEVINDELYLYHSKWKQKAKSLDDPVNDSTRPPLCHGNLFLWCPDACVNNYNWCHSPCRNWHKLVRSRVVLNAVEQYFIWYNHWQCARCRGRKSEDNKANHAELVHSEVCPEEKS